MSADNGVYILPVEDRYGTVWFVNHRQAIENLVYQPDRKDGYNTQEVLKFIVEADKFRVRSFALEAAHDQAKKLEICEYGVVELDKVVLEG